LIRYARAVCRTRWHIDPERLDLHDVIDMLAVERENGTASFEEFTGHKRSGVARSFLDMVYEVEHGN